MHFDRAETIECVRSLNDETSTAMQLSAANPDPRTIM